MSTDPTLRLALSRLGIIAAARHIGRFEQPMRVGCPRCGDRLPAGWSGRWNCPSCACGGDQVDYLTSTGLSFPAARNLLLDNATSWSSWEKEALRRALPMPYLLGRLGIPLRHGRIRCLDGSLHRRGDVTPSCAVYPDAVHCFACGFHTDIFGVWARMRSTEFRTAWLELLALAQELDSPVTVNPGLVRGCGTQDGTAFAELYAAVLDCCEPLADTPVAGYLAGRAINPVLAGEFGVRWVSNPALGRIQRLLGAYPAEFVTAAGLVEGDGLFVLRQHRLIFPAHRDEKIVWLQGRSTRQGVAKRWRWRSLTGITPCPLGLPQLLDAAAEEPVHVAEGPTDWLAMASTGRTVIGVPWAQAIATWWLRLLAGRRVVLCHDADDAGELGAQLWRERLRPFRATVQRLPLPLGTDLCDCLVLLQSQGRPGELPAPVALPEPVE
ncbi:MULTISPECIES: hypothetical protein [unclassified Crossiella]|uniref:hypothetical protein n=1 Tax=unclassified Crossiella TaxID=2620835 RepID=UPI001FFF71CE|nr:MULTISPECIES: hypothetical protein [unclassified Crossiella]MCK2240660.1 hypothetical protein [Crossiella sp. S99.2]MCK2252889.1 hypothetical protein [Crossiella sp. S99.1]